MADLTAQRTLVKSPPELWTELSEVESLAKHLGELGEIRITKVEPESTVAWEGDAVRGTVELEQSGWGTKVTFTATVPEPGPAAEPVEVTPEPVAAEPAPEPVVEPEPAEPPKRQGFLARWLFRQRAPQPEPEPAAVDPEPEPEPAPEPVAAMPEPAPDADAEHIQRVLDGTLDALGQAHHRPFSRG